MLHGINGFLTQMLWSALLVSTVRLWQKRDTEGINGCLAWKWYVFSFLNFKFSSLELKIFFKRPRPGMVSKKPRNNCTELSNSMTKRENKRNQQKYGSFPKGCPGAVWPNGKPSKKYCSGMDKWGNPNSLWHSTCCIWKGSKCMHNPKYRYKKNVINVIRRWGKRMKRPRNSIKILGEKFLSWKWPRFYMN